MTHAPSFSFAVPIAVLAALATDSSAQIYATDFATMDGWAVVGTPCGGVNPPIWAADATPSSRPAGPYTSAPASLNFNNGIDFDTTCPGGTVRSPGIDLALAGGTPLLRFMYSMGGEFGCEWDRLTLRVGAVSGGATVLEVCLDHVGLESPFVNHEFALDSSWGQVWIEFEFESLDDIGNDLSGPFIDDLEIVDSCTLVPTSDCSEPRAFCFGDGSGTACPCNNATLPGLGRGCLNSSGRGARLVSSGQSDVAADTLRFTVDGAPAASFAFLVSGGNALPMSPLGAGIQDADGLRCVGGGLLRHGSRSTDAAGTVGVTTAGWGPPNGPSGGLAMQGGFVPGQSRYFQVIVRDDLTQVCGGGVNRTNGVKVTFH